MYYQLKQSKLLLLLLLLVMCGRSISAQGTLSPLHVEGPFLVNAEGRRVNMHGFAQTFSPWFNERGTKWNNYDVNGCLNYNKGIINGILNAGWKMTFVRQHMDPYWSNNPDWRNPSDPNDKIDGEADIRAFSFERFKTYLDAVFVPMAEYAISKGLYVIMRPPGVCPEVIALGDAYHNYLKKVWGYVAQHERLKNNGAILFELANEPVNINSGSRDRDEVMTQYMQEIVDLMRQHCNNILLVPGLGWQSNYAGFARFPIKGDNIGYAVHCYPGWYNGGHGDDDVVVNYREFKRGWDAQILPVAVTNPVVVTEMDWAPSKYNSSWGKSITGVAGQIGFGANFMRICDETCNVSWLLFTDGNLLAKYNDALADGNAFLTDPEACPRPVFRRYQYYATQEYADLINQPGYGPVIKEEPLFSLTEEWFNPSIWETGTFDETTGKLITGQYGFGGWQYNQGVDLSGAKYLVVELNQPQDVGASFRLFDINNYWSSPYMKELGSDTRVIIDLHNMTAQNDGHHVDPSHIYIAGFWSYGGKPIYIKNVFLSNDGTNPVTGIDSIAFTQESEGVSKEYYTLDGRRLSAPQPGLNIVKVTDNNGKIRIFKVCYKI